MKFSLKNISIINLIITSFIFSCNQSGSKKIKDLIELNNKNNISQAVQQNDNKLRIAFRNNFKKGNLNYFINCDNEINSLKNQLDKTYQENLNSIIGNKAISDVKELDPIISELNNQLKIGKDSQKQIQEAYKIDLNTKNNKLENLKNRKKIKKVEYENIEKVEQNKIKKLTNDLQLNKKQELEKIWKEQNEINNLKKEIDENISKGLTTLYDDEKIIKNYINLPRKKIKAFITNLNSSNKEICKDFFESIYKTIYNNSICKLFGCAEYETARDKKINFINETLKKIKDIEKRETDLKKIIVEESVNFNNLQNDILNKTNSLEQIIKNNNEDLKERKIEVNAKQKEKNEFERNYRQNILLNKNEEINKLSKKIKDLNEYKNKIIADEEYRKRIQEFKSYKEAAKKELIKEKLKDLQKNINILNLLIKSLNTFYINDPKKITDKNKLLIGNQDELISKEIKYLYQIIQDLPEYEYEDDFEKIISKRSYLRDEYISNIQYLNTTYSLLTKHNPNSIGVTNTPSDYIHLPTLYKNGKLILKKYKKGDTINFSLNKPNKPSKKYKYTIKDIVFHENTRIVNGDKGQQELNTSRDFYLLFTENPNLKDWVKSSSILIEDESYLELDDQKSEIVEKGSYEFEIKFGNAGVQSYDGGIECSIIAILRCHNKKALGQKDVEAARQIFSKTYQGQQFEDLNNDLSVFECQFNTKLYNIFVEKLKQIDGDLKANYISKNKEFLPNKDNILVIRKSIIKNDSGYSKCPFFINNFSDIIKGENEFEIKIKEFLSSNKKQISILYQNNSHWKQFQLTKNNNKILIEINETMLPWYENHKDLIETANYIIDEIIRISNMK